MSWRPTSSEEDAQWYDAQDVKSLLYHLHEGQHRLYKAVDTIRTIAVLALILAILAALLYACQAVLL